jgi:haloalkane dehalogenase
MKGDDMTAPAELRGIDFRPSRELFPFRSRWLDSSVGRIHYIDEGEGAAILFLHGNPTWSFLYRHIVWSLRDRFRCIALDYPGFGLSDRPPGYGYTPAEHARIVGELIDHLGLEHLLVMGQDWGGPIGLAVALEAPERITGFVLGNTWFWPLTRTSDKLFAHLFSSPVGQWTILRRNVFVERFLPRLMARKLSSQEMEHYRAVQPTPDARVGIAGFPRQLLGARPWLTRLAEEVPNALGSKPTLLVWGMEDKLTFRPSVFLPPMQAAFPDHELVQLPGAKHYIQEDAPQDIAEAILKRFG